MADHVVILQHGILGSTKDLSNICKALRFWHHEQLHVVLSDVNENHTMDGVTSGGQRLASLIKQHQPRRGGSLSLCCHSLGGIYARSALSILEEEGWFDANAVNAANFVAIATPHLGIVEIEAYWRRGISLIGGVVGASIRDLALHTDVIPKLCDEVSLKALQRFKRRVAYGNADDDLWVRTCSALILPSQSIIGNEPLDEGEPREVTGVEDCHDPASTDFTSYPKQYREAVCQMFKALNRLSWERYIVHFSCARWTGAAHVKICNHYEDVHNSGENLVAHICRTFILPEAGELAQETLVPEIVKKQDDASVETFSCFSLHGFGLILKPRWFEEKGKSLDETMAWIKEHDGHSRGVVKVYHSAEGDRAEWFHAWLPTNNWHKMAIMRKVKQKYPRIKGNIDAARKTRPGKQTKEFASKKTTKRHVDDDSNFCSDRLQL